MSKNQHVVPHAQKWAVKPEGGKRATKVTMTQVEALETARRIARNQGVDVVIHGRDGRTTIDAYGIDPLRLLKPRR